MKYLFIDDHAKWLASLKRCFSQNPNVAFDECHTVKDALLSIKKHQPQVIFLDHSLTEGGKEGLKIADKVGGTIKIYSTTTNESVIPEYQKRGIENVDKCDLAKIKSLIGE